MDVQRRRVPLTDRGVFNLTEAAEYLQMDPKALRAGLEDGSLPIGYWRGAGGRGEWRICRADCDVYIRRRCDEYAQRLATQRVDTRT